MKQRNKILLTVMSAVLMLTLLAGAVIGTLTAFAESEEEYVAGTGTTLPDDAEVWDGTSASSLEGGGTASDPYLIANAAEFMYFRNTIAPSATADTYAELTGDLYFNTAEYKNASGKGTNDIGAVSGKSYAGVLNGNGHTVYNAYHAGYNSCALFDTLSGTVKDLNFAGAYITSSNANAAAVAVNVSGKVENVRVTLSTFRGKNVGGIAQGVSGGAVIRNCSVSGVVKTGYDQGGSAGGIIGNYGDTTGTAPLIEGCVNNATVMTAKAANMGGIIAYVGSTNVAVGITIRDCTNNGAVTVTAGTCQVGGIIGNYYRVKNVVLENCTNNGALTGTAQAGGMIGKIVSDSDSAASYSVSLSGCINRGAVTSSGNYAGGLIGLFTGSKNNRNYVTDCANYGAVTGASYVGGFIGELASNDWSECNLYFRNSANYGAVTATVKYAGGIAGRYRAASTSGGILADGVILTGDVSAPTNAGALTGILAAKTGTTSTKCQLNDVWVIGKVTVDADGVAALISTETSCSNGHSVTASDSGFYVQIIKGETPVSSPAGYISSTGEEVASTLPTVEESAFAASALASLNSYAAANSNREWMPTGSPYYVEFYVAPVDITNASSLSHSYDGTAVEVAWQVNSDSVETVDVIYYNIADEENPVALAGAPSDAGKYRVKLLPKDAGGNVIAEDKPVQTDFTISKASVTFAPTDEVLNHWTAESATSFYTTYDGNALTVEAKVVSQVTGLVLDGIPAEVSIRLGSDLVEGTSITEPGTYTATFSVTFEETANYNSGSVDVTLTINKIPVSYPAADSEGRWTVPAGYNQNAQSVVFNLTAEESLLIEAALTGDVTATNVTPEGTTLVAYATLSLKDPDHYAFDGTAPEYKCEWTMGKGTVKLAVYDSDGNPVERLEDIVYTGTEKVYTVKAVDTAGNVVKTYPDQIRVLNVEEHHYTFAFTEEDAGANYNALTEALTLDFTVSPADIEISISGIANRDYNGSALSGSYALTDSKGYTWNDFVLQWYKWNESNGEWEPAREAKNAGKYRLIVTCETDDTLNYRGKGTVDEVTISRATPVLAADTTGYTNQGGIWTVTYDGTAKRVGWSCADSFFDRGDFITITYNGNNQPYNAAGTYEVVIVYDASNDPDNVNFNSSAPVTVTIKIEKAQVQLPANLWAYTSPFTYDGTLKKVVLNADFLRDYGALISVEYDPETNAGKTNAGIYSAAATIRLNSPDNMEFISAAGAVISGSDYRAELEEWEIGKADVDLSGIIFSSSTVPYNGQLQGLVARNVPSYLSVEYSQGGIDADTYRIVATFTLTDTSNYNSIPAGQETKTAQLTITQAEVEIQLDSDSSTTVTFNNRTHTLQVVVCDDFGREYEESVAIKTINGMAPGSVEVKNAGTYTFVFTLTNDNLTGDDFTATLTVNRATYAASDYRVNNVELIYDGEAHTWDVSGLGTGLDTVGITVVGTLPTYTQPGTYTYTLHLQGSDNYHEIAPIELTMTILAASAEDEESGVTVTFPDGIDPTYSVTVDVVEITSEMRDALKVEGLFDNAGFELIWNIVATDADGTAVSPATGSSWTVTLLVPEHLRSMYAEERLTLVKLSYNTKDGTFKSIEKFGKKTAPLYDEEKGTLTFTLTSAKDLSFSYALVAEQNPVPAIAVLGVAGVLLVATVTVGIIRLRAIRRKRFEEMYEEVDEL